MQMSELILSIQVHCSSQIAIRIWHSIELATLLLKFNCCESSADISASTSSTHFCFGKCGRHRYYSSQQESKLVINCQQTIRKFNYE